MIKKISIVAPPSADGKQTLKMLTSLVKVILVNYLPLLTDLLYRKYCENDLSVNYLPLLTDLSVN